MLKRQYKILALLGFLLIVWLIECNDRCFIGDSGFIHNSIRRLTRFRWQTNTCPPLNLSGLEYFTLPNFKKEASIDDWSNKPWFVSWGNVRPKPSSNTSSSSLFPDPRRPYDDRITQQLMYVPPDYGSETKHKLVLLHDYIGGWISHEEGPSAFENCPVDRCILTTKKNRFKEADAVIFDNTFKLPKQPKSKGQVWIIYMLESPAHTNEFQPANVFNWTITYRPDSDIPAPYAKWFYHGPEHRKTRPLRNFAANKTLKVAWFVSNCKAKNIRNEYAAELQKYIKVDIFGDCGEIKCPRDEENKCFKFLAKSYKFYLAFENSNCDYYITEKFFKNALRHNVVPIVMGARRGDYEHAGPAASFIHVNDFDSPQQLAKYLHKLDKDDDLYNQYFLWRGTGEFIQHKFFCRLCTLLHSKNPPKYYKDINQWWRGNHACSSNY